MLQEQVKRAQAKGYAIKSIIRLHTHLTELNKNPYKELRNGKTQPTERITRQKLIAHYEGHYDRFFTRDDVQKWEHEFTRTAQFKAYTAYTKPHSYLDEFIPF